MFGRGVAFLAVGIVLAGCAAPLSGIYFADRMQTIGPPKAGQSRVVVFQENAKGSNFEKTACDVKLDGTLLGKLPPGTYVYADRPAGKHQLMVTEDLFPGDTTREVMLEPGRTHYFLSKASGRRNSLMAMSMAGGLTGLVVGSAMTSGSDNPGPVDLYPLDETAARVAVAELQLAK